MTSTKDILIKTVIIIWTGILYLAVFSAILVAAYGMYLGLMAMFGIQPLAIFLAVIFGAIISFIVYYIIRILAF